MVQQAVPLAVAAAVLGRQPAEASNIGLGLVAPRWFLSKSSGTGARLLKSVVLMRGATVARSTHTRTGISSGLLAELESHKPIMALPFQITQKSRGKAPKAGIWGRHPTPAAG